MKLRAEVAIGLGLLSKGLNFVESSVDVQFKRELPFMIMLKIFSFLFCFLLIGRLIINGSNARSLSLSGEWLTISQLAQKHPDWLAKDEELSDFADKGVYLVNEQHLKLFVNAICKVNPTAVSQYLQQDVCSLQYVCGQPFNLCYEEDPALENLIWGDIYILLNNNGLPQKTTWTK